MIELFADLSDEVKRRNEYIVDFAIKTFEPQQCFNFLSSYAHSCENEEEKQFIDFYFQLRMEQILNESNNDKR